jgi:hypothetical protein
MQKYKKKKFKLVIGNRSFDCQNKTGKSTTEKRSKNNAIDTAVVLE